MPGDSNIIHINYYKEMLNAPIKGRSLRCAEMLSTKGKSILDVGCSYGWLQKYHLKNGAKKTIGIDTDRVKINLVSKLVPKAEFRVGSALKLEFKNNSFDNVAFFEVIEHIPSGTEEEALKEIYRVLKPSGVLALSTPLNSFWSQLLDPAWYFGHRHYGSDDLKVLLKKVGFKKVDISYGGGFWELFGMLNLYFSKWILRRDMLFKDTFETNRNKEYERKDGFVTLFIKAHK
jgi:SAM-dependent methyltransferase